VAKTVEKTSIHPYEYLATRVEQASVDKLIEASRTPDQPAVRPAPAKAPEGATSAAGPVKETIDYDTFAKADLRVAKVVSAELVEGADKLLKLLLDIGETAPRQVFAGIRKAYDPATLVGRQVVMVANLAPRKMRFGLSEGMILAAGNPDGALFVVSPDAGAMPGATVK
ncbi:MAG: methionine--tRNA ligase subunit beta, partial [Kiritimatiellae bacterium]|nr:methionine--tRNA ligase subunit beta [Kiritimatiellia bacterium]